MDIKFILTRPNFVDIMSGVLLFEDEQEYSNWMNNYWNKFQICTNLKTRVLTLINYPEVR